MKKILLNLILICFMAKASGQSENYSVIRVNSLIKLEDSLDGKFLFQHEIFKCLVHRLSDGRYTLSPASSQFGLLIENEQTLDSILSNRIPIPDDYKSPFEIFFDFQNGSSISAIYSEFLIQCNLIPNEITDEENVLKAILKIIGSIPKERRYKEIMVPLGVFIGERIRNRIGGEWKYERLYGVNPYDSPYILLNEGSCIDPFYKLSDKLSNNKLALETLFSSIFKPFIMACK